MRYGDTFHIDSSIFPVRTYGYDSGIYERRGLLSSAYDTFYNRNSWNKTCMDIRRISTAQVIICIVYIISGFMGTFDSYAADMYACCKEEDKTVNVINKGRHKELLIFTPAPFVLFIQLIINVTN